MTTRRRILLANALLAFAIAATVMAGGSESPAFDLSWSTVDGGGGPCAGGSLDLHGTIGQPDAGSPLVGGNLELVGGFWPASTSGIAPCPADVNGDLIVNIADLLAVVANWGQTGPNPADVTGNGIVNIQDLLAVVAAWGSCP